MYQLGKEIVEVSGEEDYFCHILIPSQDLDASKRFYEGVFGWRVTEPPDTGSLDVLPRSCKGVSAELNRYIDVPMPSVRTFDIEGRLALVEEFGGRKLVGKTPISKNAEHGHYALFEDPQGNKLCLYSNK